MMATTQPEDIPQTIRSRCQHFSFHAVRFDEIVGQLRAIAKQEGIKTDDSALALLAEAGDGSMRDALSIMDQAIACCGTTLTAEVVRGLVGAIPSETLEEILDAVAANSSEHVLRLLDRVITEGQNPAHFARQMVRFLRNAVMAKVGGGDSPLLQISADERARVARVAEKFSEEDLARFLQILLRTYSELSYKQEQRFHLELGLLKLVHAQRLLPIEELLSQAPAGAGRATSPAPSRPTASLPQPSRAPEPSRPSPFEQDRARKSTGPKAEMSAGMAIAERTASGDDLVSRVLQELEGKHGMLAHHLEQGEWKVEEAEVVVRTGAAAKMLEMLLKPDARKIMNSTASAALGRQVKVQVVGGAANGNSSPAPAPPRAGRARASEDPVVRRMQEKFGAEIRTVIDHKEKQR